MQNNTVTMKKKLKVNAITQPGFSAETKDNKSADMPPLTSWTLAVTESATANPSEWTSTNLNTEALYARLTYTRKKPTAEK